MRLRDELEKYLTTRRALGYQLVQTEREAGQFCDWLAKQGKTDTFSIDDAITWARQPVGVHPARWADRLTRLRPFAAYLNAAGWNVPVIPRALLPRGSTRTTPFIYTQNELDLLLGSCPLVFENRRVAITMKTILGLLAATGMRIGETTKLLVPDFDSDQHVLLVRGAKTPLDRLIALHPSTTKALLSYLSSPERAATRPDPQGALFVSYQGTGFSSRSIEQHYRYLTAAVGIGPRDGARPRLHDFRHTFATAHMVAAYRNGTDPQRTLGLLATWLGHTNVADTYWYLSATPELIALAAQHLETKNLT